MLHLLILFQVVLILNKICTHAQKNYQKVTTYYNVFGHLFYGNSTIRFIMFIISSLPEMGK